MANRGVGVVDPEKLERALNRKLMTLTELSQLSGVSYRTITKAKTGRHGNTLLVLRALAEALGIGTDEASIRRGLLRTRASARTATPPSQRSAS